MNRALFIPGALILLFLYHPPLDNGRALLGAKQFEQAKQAFGRQDFFQAQVLSQMALSNLPGAAAPRLLIGSCYYLQGQDQAALFHYRQALAIDPHIGHLPPFLGHPSQAGPRRTLPPGKLASLRRKIGQMIMVSVPGTKLSGQKRTMLQAGWIGGVILFDQNVRSKSQLASYVADLQRHSPTPLFVAVDQEGGAVRRLREPQGFSTLPSLAALGRTKDKDLAYRFGRLSGSQLKAVGANLNLAPVVDIDYGVKGSIISKYHRSLGKDPRLVSSLAGEIVRGMRSQNIIATAKHFPTMSVAAANPHHGVSVADLSREELEGSDLVPYRSLIRQNLLDAVMLSHVIYRGIDPSLPASLSPVLIQDYLRKGLGYKGLVLSDDLRMDAVKQRFPLEVSVVQAVKAGVDILLVTDNYERRVMEALVRAVEDGRVPAAKIDEAYARIMGVKEKYGIVKKTHQTQTAGSRYQVPGAS